MSTRRDMGHPDLGCIRNRVRTGKSRDRSRSPSGMTTKGQLQRQIQGSLHCATDDSTVRRFGRDDVFYISASGVSASGVSASGLSVCERPWLFNGALVGLLVGRRLL